MKKLRTRCALFFAWLFVLYNIERLHAPINLASFVYVLAAVLAVAIVATPRPQRLSIALLLVLVVPVIVLLKLRLGYPVLGAHLPLTVTEITSTWLTITLAYQLARSLEDLRHAAVTTLMTHLCDRTQAFEQGEGAMYREIRRARVHERPLALLAVAPSEESVNATLDRFTLELQQDCARNYVAARIAELLSREMKECDIITYRGNHFITILPEAGHEKATATINKLKALARERLGIELRIGVSLFPDDEVTLVELLEHAQGEMHKAVQFAPDQSVRDQAAGDQAACDQEACDQEVLGKAVLENAVAGALRPLRVEVSEELHEFLAASNASKRY